MNASVKLDRADELSKEVTLSENELASKKSKLLNEQDLLKPTFPPSYGPPAVANWNFSIQMVVVLLAVILLVIFSLLLY